MPGYAQYFQMLRQHPLKPTITTKEQVERVVQEQWAELQTRCDKLRDAKIEVVMDDSLGEAPVLAWASRTHVLVDGVWVPSVLTDLQVERDILIGVNAHIPNGWAMTCHEGLRYHLPTVMLHELLHGAGISSSVTDTSVGYTIGSHCFPNLMDLQMKDKYGNKLVHGCTYNDTDRVFVNGVELFHPEIYVSGSSLSHTKEMGIMNYQIAPQTCLSMQSQEVKILNTLDLHCSAANILEPLALFLLIYMILL